MKTEAFFDRVEAYSDKARILFPNETTFTKKQLSQISGIAYSTLCNNADRYHFTSKRVSIKEFVRMVMS